MHKCWNCGTEHETNDDASYRRGWNAALQTLMQDMQDIQAYVNPDHPIDRFVKLFDMDDMILGHMR